MRFRKKYLTMQQKKEIALEKGYLPVCVSGTKRKNSFIAKLRGTIFSGDLKGKNIKL